jgi:hypothetical protein
MVRAVASSRRPLPSAGHELHAHATEGDRVAERNQFPGALGGLDRRHPRHRQHIPLGGAALQHQGQGGRLHADESLSGGLAGGGGPIAHLHHVHLAGGIEVTQLGCRHLLILELGSRTKHGLPGANRPHLPP